MFKLKERKTIMDFYSIIENSNFVKKYLYDKHWISGSVTIVHPITFFRDDYNDFIRCSIQIDDNKVHWRKTFNRLFDELNNSIKDNGFTILSSYICKYDGSCPWSAEIKIKIEDNQF